MKLFKEVRGGSEGAMIPKITVNVVELISAHKYNIDEEHAHIEFVESVSDEEFAKLVKVCSAALYRVDEEGNCSFDYAGCLECGTCRIVGEDVSIARWVNPEPTMGVVYRQG